MKKKAPKKISRVQAWRKIKLAFAVFSPKDGLTKNGLCYAVRRLLHRGEITSNTYYRMENDIQKMRREAPSCYYWPTRRAGHTPEEAKAGALSRVEAITQLLKKKS